MSHAHCEDSDHGAKAGLRRTVVDCGSGWTRVEAFSRHTDDGLVWVDGRTRLDSAPLNQVLESGQGSAWLDTLEDHLVHLAAHVEESATSCAEADAVPVFIGATAGVRDAVSSGAISEAALKEFESAALAKGWEFTIIAGEAEAGLELEAVRYCVLEGLPAGEKRAPAWATPGQIGMLSSGGMSSQLVYPLKASKGGGICTLSLETKLKAEGNKACLQHGVEHGLQHYARHLESIIGELGETECGLGKLKGTYVAIEILGDVGKRAGIGRHVVTAEEAAGVLDAYLAQWVARATVEQTSAWNWKDVVHGTSALQARHMVGLLHPQASIYFSRTFVLGEGHELKPSWSLGHYISSTKTLSMKPRGDKGEGEGWPCVNCS